MNLCWPSGIQQETQKISNIRGKRTNDIIKTETLMRKQQKMWKIIRPATFKKLFSTDHAN